MYICLYGVKISNHSYSNNINDGLELKNAYITTALKCVPPGDKPNKNELSNCFSFFHNEIKNLKNLKTIVALGKIAFDSCVLFFKENYVFKDRVYFSHRKIYTLPKNINSLLWLEDKILFKNNCNFSKPIAKIKKGRLLIVKNCDGDWCKVKTGKFKGWVRKENLVGRL